jgi:hypothetical protein
MKKIIIFSTLVLIITSLILLIPKAFAKNQGGEEGFIIAKTEGGETGFRKG